MNILFRASEWPCAARALLRSYGIASGHVGLKSFPGAALRRLCFGSSSTTNRNGGQYGYYQSAGLLPVLYIGLLHGSIGRSCWNIHDFCKSRVFLRPAQSMDKIIISASGYLKEAAHDGYWIFVSMPMDHCVFCSWPHFLSMERRKSRNSSFSIFSRLFSFS